MNPTDPVGIDLELKIVALSKATAKIITQRKENYLEILKWNQPYSPQSGVTISYQLLASGEILIAEKDYYTYKESGSSPQYRRVSLDEFIGKIKEPS